MGPVSISRAGRKAVEFNFEAVDADSGAAARLFDRAARTIQAEWRARREGFGRRRDLRWLEETCYALLKRMLDLDLAGLFEERIRRHGRYPRGPRGNPNWFQKGLMALFADDPEALDRGDRERMGKRMWHAYRHYVPPVFLVGFLQQRTRDSELEPGFEDWIIERRSCERDDSGLRGTYPASVEEQVERRQRQQDRRRRDEDHGWE